MEFSMLLPFQLFRINFLDLNNYWFGSFHTVDACLRYAQEIGMPANQIYVTTPQNLPVMTIDEHQRHLAQIERSLKQSRADLLEAKSLALKLAVKLSISALEKQRREFCLYVHSFVPERDFVHNALPA